MSKITPTSLTVLERAVRAAVLDIRSRLQECEDLPNFELNIEAKGRVHEGEVTISYNLEGYYTDVVKGGRLTPVLDEFARRHGWKKVNAPICIGGPAPDAEAE
jgi:hypothetical protein